MEIVSVSVASKVLSLIDQLSCPQIWNIELKDREKEKVGGKRAKLNEKKNKGDIFFGWKNNMKTL